MTFVNEMYLEGNLDWMGSPLSVMPIDAIGDLKKNDQLRVNPFLATYFLRLNVAETINGKFNPLSLLEVRRALSQSIDRESITTHILQGGETAAFSLVPPEMGLKKREDNFPHISSIKIDAPITISFASSSRNTSILQAIQKQWEKALGIEVILEAVEPQIYFQKVANKEYQLAVGSWTADFNDPINFLEVFKFKESSTNNTNWESVRYAELLNQSELSENASRRLELLSQAEYLLLSEMPIIPIFHYSLNYLKDESLQDVVLSPLGQIDFRWAHF